MKKKALHHLLCPTEVRQRGEFLIQSSNATLSAKFSNPRTGSGPDLFITRKERAIIHDSLTFSILGGPINSMTEHLRSVFFCSITLQLWGPQPIGFIVGGQPGNCQLLCIALSCRHGHTYIEPPSADVIGMRAPSPFGPAISFAERKTVCTSRMI